MRTDSAAIGNDRDQDRWLRARVDLVVSSLPLTIVLNPIWAALSIIPLGGQYPAFGGVPFYIWKSRKYTHAVWHLFVLGGVACHFVAVLSLVSGRD